MRAIITQFILACGTLLLLSLLIFALTNGSPEDVARNSLGRFVTDEQLQAYVREHGLDQPFLSRYLGWLFRFVSGDWGVSATSGRDILSELLPRMIRTLILSFAAIVIAVPLAFLLTVRVLLSEAKYADDIFLVSIVVLSSLPEFLLGILVVGVLSIVIPLLPPDSTAIAFGRGLDHAKAYVLPVITLVLTTLPHLCRIAREGAIAGFLSTYTRAAVLRGLRRRQVVWSHAMRLQASTLISAVALNLIYLLGGVIVVENVFAFPGIGQQLISAIGQSDTVTVAAISMVLGTLFILVNLLADLIAAAIDPRSPNATN